MTIFITEPKDYSQKALAIYKTLGQVYFLSEINKNKLNSFLFKVNLLVIRIATNVDRNFIDQMPNLQVIATSTTGLNHIDINYAKSKKIKIISLRGRKKFLRNIPSTAEETFALILSLVRNVPWAFDDVKLGNWRGNDWRGRQLMGKTIGLLGFGRLGRIMARYAKAFGMKVIVCDPNVSAAFAKSRGVVKTDMESLFKKSDIVSLHVLLTDKTHNLVQEKHLKMMKPPAYLINTARAELIEQGALEKALKGKWIAGAAVDVMWDEKGDGSHLKTSALLAYAKKNKNLIILPHIGGATFEAMATTQDYIAELVFKNIKNKQ